MGGGFANQQSQYSQTPQYQAYGDSSAGTPTGGGGGVPSSKQPSYGTYSNYGNSFAQPSFGGQKADLYSGHAAQPQVGRFSLLRCQLQPVLRTQTKVTTLPTWWWWVSANDRCGQWLGASTCI